MSFAKRTFAVTILFKNVLCVRVVPVKPLGVDEIGLINSESALSLTSNSHKGSHSVFLTTARRIVLKLF